MKLFMSVIYEINLLYLLFSCKKYIWTCMSRSKPKKRGRHEPLELDLRGSHPPILTHRQNYPNYFKTKICVWYLSIQRRLHPATYQKYLVLWQARRKKLQTFQYLYMGKHKLLNISRGIAFHISIFKAVTTRA